MDVEDVADVVAAGRTPKVGTGGGTAAEAIMAMIPILGAAHGGCGRPDIPLGLRLAMVIPKPT